MRRLRRREVAPEEMALDESMARHRGQPGIAARRCILEQLAGPLERLRRPPPLYQPSSAAGPGADPDR
ncbi:hypothetical protein [Sorangium sp. So ce341]|uniref:hypothetical protein n=1 Tax=Sorangium sp. So ce341 TaxID=3133302 RepID=UPI003F606EC0